MSDDAMLLGKIKQPLPIDRLDQLAELIRIEMSGSALEQDQPLTLKGTCLRWIRQRQSGPVGLLASLLDRSFYFLG